MFDGWILKGEKFPSSLDHPLTTSQRYVDFCESGNNERSIRSSQNVAMIFFRIQQPGNGFTVTVKKSSNLFRKSALHTTKGAWMWGRKQKECVALHWIFSLWLPALRWLQQGRWSHSHLHACRLDPGSVCVPRKNKELKRSHRLQDHKALSFK